jgi:hypothetical protein
MSVDERHRRLYKKLEDVLGSEEAETLIDELATRVVTPELLRQELLALESRMETRFDLKLEILEERIDRKIANAINEQTKTLYRTIVVSNATMVLAVAGLAFGAARIA